MKHARVIHDGAVTAHLTEPDQDVLVAALRGRVR